MAAARLQLVIIALLSSPSDSAGDIELRPVQSDWQWQGLATRIFYDAVTNNVCPVDITSFVACWRLCTNILSEC